MADRACVARSAADRNDSADPQHEQAHQEPPASFEPSQYTEPDPEAAAGRALIPAL